METFFQKGWRPFAGWVCGGAMAYHYIIQPFLMFLMACFGVVISPIPFDMTSFITVLFAILGLGGLRSYEKKKVV